MTLHQFKIFAAVARRLSITKAAQELGMSQPSVSHQLRQLEEECERSFYFSTQRGVQLTPDGQAFLREAIPILMKVGDLETKFAPKQTEDKTDLLIVGGNHTLSVTLLPEILMAFKQTHPWVTYQLETSDSRTMERRILNGEVEIGVVTNPSHSPQIALEPFRRHEMVAFVPSTSSLTGQSVTLKDFARLPLVVRGGGTTVSELLKRGFKLNIAAQCEVSEAVKAAVNRGLGVGLLNRDSIERDLMNGQLTEVHIPDLQTIKVQSFIVYDKRRSLSDITQDLRQILLKNRDRKVPAKGKTAPRRQSPLKTPDISG